MPPVAIASFIVEKDGSITNVKIVKNRTGCNDFSKEAKESFIKQVNGSPLLFLGKSKDENYLPLIFYFSN